MHRIFSLPTTLHNEKHKKKVTPFTSKLLGSNPELEYILIDESGFLLNSDYLVLLEHRIKRFNKATRNRKRRNLKLILIGDFLQIPSFCKPDEASYMKMQYGSQYFFKSALFQKMKFNVVNIKQVMRTDNNTFKACQDAMRYGQEERYPRLCQWMNKVMYKPSIPAGLPVMCIYNKEADKVNQIALDRNPNQPFFYQSVVSGDYQVKNCPSGASVTLKEGCLVMTLVNDLEENKYQNGSTGVVTMCMSEGVYIRFQHSGEEVFVGMNIFEQCENVYKGENYSEFGPVKPSVWSEVVGECHAMPVQLAYGLSIHKNQGATITTPCVVDLGGEGFKSWNSFGEALAYVATSRFSSPELIYLKYPITPAHIKVNKEILAWIVELEAKEA